MPVLVATGMVGTYVVLLAINFDRSIIDRLD